MEEELVLSKPSRTNLNCCQCGAEVSSPYVQVNQYRTYCQKCYLKLFPKQEELKRNDDPNP